MVNQLNQAYVSDNRRVNLIWERVKRNLTPKQVAVELGVNPNSVRAWERGEWAPRYEHLMSLCQLYDADARYLMATQQTTEGPDDA